MKTKRLIELLQEADPSGELECCVGNQDILSVDTVNAGYWDGCLQVLERDPAKAPYYDVVGGKFCADQPKVDIQPWGIFDAVMDDPGLVVTYDSEYAEQHYAAKVEQTRADALKIGRTPKEPTS